MYSEALLPLRLIRNQSRFAAKTRRGVAAENHPFKLYSVFAIAGSRHVDVADAKRIFSCGPSILPIAPVHTLSSTLSNNFVELLSRKLLPSFPSWFPYKKSSLPPFPQLPPGAPRKLGGSNEL